MEHAELLERINVFLDGLPELLDGISGPVSRGKAYRAELFRAGLAGLDVPIEYGGVGLDAVAKATFDAHVLGKLPPEADLFVIGLGMAVPTLLEHASEELKHRYIEPALRGDEIWCQMYSEPGAGSDLAGLQSQALFENGQWVLNGQKIWTSMAADADFAVCLARTDANVPKHEGLTMFVLPMKQQGVTVRPIRQITGDHEFNEIFMDDAIVPSNHVIGSLNEGWKVALSLLLEERQSVASGGGRQPVPFHLLLNLVAGSSLHNDTTVRSQLTDCWIGQRLASLFDEYQAQLVAAGTKLDSEVSLGKLWRSENGRRARELVSRVAFAESTAWRPGDGRDRWTHAILDSCALSLGGGTDEVMLNTIAERVLQLPRDPSNNDKAPFRELRIGTVAQLGEQ